MITVNEQIYAAFGGIENKKRYDASHNTYDYIEERLAYTDFVEQNILLNLLLHYYEDIIPVKIIDEIHDEIINEPIKQDTPRRIRNKVENVILETPETVDDFARTEIDRLLTIIDSIFTVLNTNNDTLNTLLDNVNSTNEKTTQLYNIITELNKSLNNIKQTNSKLEQETVNLKTHVKELESNNIQLNKEIILLKAKNEVLKNDIKELSKKQTKTKPVIHKVQQNKQQHNSCLCDDFYGRYSSIYGMVI